MAKSLMTEGISGKVLKWAREKQGLSHAEVAARLKCSAELVHDWEEGRQKPTFHQAEFLAYSLYKRPLAVFYLPVPPEEPSLKEEFRSLPEAELEKLLSDTRYKVRLAHTFKLTLEELNDGRNPAKNKIFELVKLDTAMKVTAAAKALREHLGVSLAEQVAWKNNDAALKGWREAAEAGGVFVFKQSFKQKSISGFCLMDKEFPVILINNSTPASRQIFTLLHELIHILLGVSTISLVEEWNTTRFNPKAKAIEVFCNAVAGELLVPSEDFSAQFSVKVKVDDALVLKLAGRYHVSRETILRRFLDRGLVSAATYKSKAAEWAKQAVKFKAKGGGGDYYNTQVTYLGGAFLRLVFSRHYQGRISVEQVAEYLGVKAKNLSALEAKLYPKSSGS